MICIPVRLYLFGYEFCIICALCLSWTVVVESLYKSNMFIIDILKLVDMDSSHLAPWTRVMQQNKKRQILGALLTSPAIKSQVYRHSVHGLSDKAETLKV